MTEKIPENNDVEQSKRREEELKAFRAKIQGLRESQERPEKHISEDLTQTVTKDLTGRDMEMWRTLCEWKDNPLSSEKMRNVLDEYTQDFLDEKKSRREGVSDGRYAFLQFVRNEAQGPIVRKQMKELEKERGI